MTPVFEDAEQMSLLAYELLTDHGFALPLFGMSASANALHVAISSRPGDPVATVLAFDVYDPQTVNLLDVSRHRLVNVGAAWIDVFLWEGVPHVGTRSELWAAMSFARDEMVERVPLTLLALAEAVDLTEAVRCAIAAHGWLARDWGLRHADRWRINNFMRRIALRDLHRHFDSQLNVGDFRRIFNNLQLNLRESTLEIKLPRASSLVKSDLPDLVSAAEGFGWRLELTLETDNDVASILLKSRANRALVMRLRHGRGRTQTQIPLRVVDKFFERNLSLRDVTTGRFRTMTLSKADGRRNTMKLQLPEIATMSDPVARFVRGTDGVQFELFDASSAEGRSIAALLDAGLQDGSTHRTRGGATWWRLVPP